MSEDRAEWDGEDSEKVKPIPTVGITRLEMEDAFFVLAPKGYKFRVPGVTLRQGVELIREASE